MVSDGWLLHNLDVVCRQIGKEPKKGPFENQWLKCIYTASKATNDADSLLEDNVAHLVGVLADFCIFLENKAR
jgi:hypothetical protein